MVRAHAAEAEVLRGTFGPGLTSGDPVPGVPLYGWVSVTGACQVNRMAFQDVAFSTDYDLHVLGRI